MSFNAFTDIEFNPKRSINCQAYTVALYKSLAVRGELEDCLKSKEIYLSKLAEMVMSNSQEDHSEQPLLF